MARITTAVFVSLLALSASASVSTSGGILATPTTTNTTVSGGTSVATNQPFSGFTLGAAIIAVLVGGLYWYYQHW